MTWPTVETILRWVCGVITVGSMSIAVFRVTSNLQRANKSLGGNPVPRLRNPWFYIVGSVLFTTLLILLWRPVKINLPNGLIIVLDIVGSVLLLAGLAGYQWGHITLGKMFTGSSSKEAPLFQDHALITEGPYQITRHPMYLSLQIATLGSLILYRNWAVVFCFFSFLFLFIRARREEEALNLRYDEIWRKYSERVPFWFPRKQNKRNQNY
jgi:protein-S-isoprenylcysteine O-methyltransferase Ste14